MDYIDKIIKITDKEIELSNGLVYPLLFEMNNKININDFQKIINTNKQIILEQINK